RHPNGKWFCPYMSQDRGIAGLSRSTLQRPRQPSSSNVADLSSTQPWPHRRTQQRAIVQALLKSVAAPSLRSSTQLIVGKRLIVLYSLSPRTSRHVATSFWLSSSSKRRFRRCSPRLCGSKPVSFG